tara:strand:+ start:205 stop:744 length:540 start_codon:yes stop_codon:yes gene_type:complete
MLGLGNTLTASTPAEGLITLSSFLILTVQEAHDDENVIVSARFTDQTLDDLMGYDGANNSAGDQQGGTYTLEVSRLDGSDNPIAGTGGTSSGTVYAYRANGNAGHSPGLVYISAQNEAGGIAVSNFEAEGSALIDLSTFGGDDITGTSDSSNYRFTLTATGSGYTSAQTVSSNVGIDKP